MPAKIIFYELNEVPFKIIEYFTKIYPDSTLAKIFPQARKYESYAEDKGHLSPWITWPTLHRGVSNEKHFISDFGQDLTEQDQQFPTTWNILAQNKVKVGVFGSLHTYPPPPSYENFAYYVPDMFAAGSECFPKKIEAYQRFNLTMSRESGRNVSAGMPIKETLNFLTALPELGFKFKTALDVANQLVEERTDKWKVVRRRTYQTVIAFDLFMAQLKRNKPDYTTFFTNHVASSMHRYWAASFPEDYDNIELTQQWLEQYNSEIVFTMKKADEMIRRLVEFADQNPEYNLWILSSMGQEAYKANSIESQLYVSNPEKFMNFFGINKSEWQSRPSMLPQFNVLVNENKRKSFLEQLATLKVNDHKFDFREHTAGFFALDWGHPNLADADTKIEYMGKPVENFRDMGLENVEIKDKSGTTAYHIPQGSMLVYDPKDTHHKQGITQLSTLDIAPTILQNFGIKPKAYMNKAAF